jgi:hypothetical protein
MALVCAFACGGDDDRSTSGEIDASLSDARTGFDAAAQDAGGFVCGDETCDDSAEYCYQVQAGARAGGVTRGCNPLPAQCAAPATCDCVLDRIQPACAGVITCDDAGERVTVICGLP